MATTPRMPVPPRWTNQQVTLYHGTVQAFLPSILAGIDLDQGRTHTDFGRGFYTTTWLRQAQSMAWRLAENRKSPPVPRLCRVRPDQLSHGPRRPGAGGE